MGKRNLINNTFILKSTSLLLPSGVWYLGLTPYSLTVNLCYLINSIQALGNASPHLLLSVIGTKGDHVWCCECSWIVSLLISHEPVSWFREDLSNWRAYVRKAYLTFQILSFKEHKCNRFLLSEESLASRAGCQFFVFLLLMLKWYSHQLHMAARNILQYSISHITVKFAYMKIKM